MSSVPSINAFAAVHTRHHGSDSEIQPTQSDQHEDVPVATKQLSNMKSEEKAKSSIFEMFGNFIGKLNFTGHDGVFFGTPSEESDKTSNQTHLSENSSILSRVRHLSSSSVTSGDESQPPSIERRSTSN